MKVLVFALANEDVLLQRLRKRFPRVGFKKSRKTDDLEGEGRDIVAFDTFRGISRVMLVDSLRAMKYGSHIDGHGLTVTLRVLLEIGAIDSARIVAVPEGYDQHKAFAEISTLLSIINPVLG